MIPVLYWDANAFSKSPIVSNEIINKASHFINHKHFRRCTTWEQEVILLMSNQTER